jgi:site-specific DNA-methyltransferase (adenine-specific)/modification methylase
MTFERVEIGDAVLYRGDCAEVLATLDRVDAVITDPPYGIGEARANNKSRSCLAQSKDYGISDWDDAPPAAELIDQLRAMSKWQALFGGNYFHLPPSSCWLVWDKLNGKNDFADCELVWTNWPKAVRRIVWQWHGMIRQGNEERFHPTQKPLEVMKWAIDLCPKADTLLDPFMGSGTTGVAAIQLGRKFIGIEREQSYFDIACERIANAQRQQTLFDPAPVMQQEALL